MRQPENRTGSGKYGVSSAPQHEELNSAQASVRSAAKIPFGEVMKIASVGGLVTLALALAIAVVLATNQVI